MKTCARQRPRGFTLLEIMVALALFGLIVATIFSTWTGILRGRKVGIEAAAAVQRSRVAMQTIEEALDCARSFAANIQYYGFIGENGDQATLSFVAQLPESFPRSGKFGDLDVRRVTFSLEPGPGSSQQLVLRQNPVVMDWDDDEKQTPVVLAKNVKAFEMEFWDASKGDWLDEWTQTNQLPALVTITLQLGGNDPYSPRAQPAFTRFVRLPCVMVQRNWQVPFMPQVPPPGANLPPGVNPPPGVNQPPPGMNQSPPGMKQFPGGTPP